MTKLSYEGTPGESKGGMLHRDFTAKEMFEKLGYNEFYKHKTYMFYVKPLKENPNYEKDYVHLEFNFENKTFVKTYGDDNSVYEISLEELQAINKQVEELGWNNVKNKR